MNRSAVTSLIPHCKIDRFLHTQKLARKIGIIFRMCVIYIRSHICRVVIFIIICRCFSVCLFVCLSVCVKLLPPEPLGRCWWNLAWIFLEPPWCECAAHVQPRTQATMLRSLRNHTHAPTHVRTCAHAPMLYIFIYTNQRALAAVGVLHVNGIKVWFARH